MKLRIDRDAYYSPERLIDSYLDDISLRPPLHINQVYLEPCRGGGAISNALTRSGRWKVRATDLTDGWNFDANDPYYINGYRYDCSRPHYWGNLKERPDVVFTNPPFNLAAPIIENALAFAMGKVIMILRASFLEPCKGRRHLLDDRISHITYVNPRPRFRTDCKGSDRSTVVFIAWDVNHRTANPKVSYLTDWDK